MAHPHHHNVFLSPSDEHRRLRVDLDVSVVFQPLSNSAPNITQLKQLLASRYGGSFQNWHIKLVLNAFLVQTPDWLFGDDIFLDEDFWMLYHIEVLLWQTLDGSERAP